MNDRYRLRVILGAVYESGFADYPLARNKRMGIDQGLNELAEFLDIEFDEDGDIVSGRALALLRRL